MYRDEVHDHGPGRSDHRRRIGVALAVSLTLLAVEAVGAAVTGSVALLADAGHLATDALGLGIALAAVALAGRPPTARRTFGLGRLEVLAAAVNALLLLGVGGTVLVRAVGRLADPVPVAGGPLLAIGALGLVGNLLALSVLARGDRSSLNVRGAAGGARRRAGVRRGAGVRHGDHTDRLVAGRSGGVAGDRGADPAA